MARTVHISTALTGGSAGAIDGIDGNSLAAGAVADGASWERARLLGVDVGVFIQESDSNSVFTKLGDEVVTGATGNNVRDIRILVHW